MNHNWEWSEKYREALQELDRRKLRPRVHRAFDAIYARLHSLADNDYAQHRQELRAMNDALEDLRMLHRATEA